MISENYFRHFNYLTYCLIAGTLYVAEVTEEGVNRVRVLNQRGKLVHFAGRDGSLHGRADACSTVGNCSSCPAAFNSFVVNEVGTNCRVSIPIIILLAG